MWARTSKIQADGVVGDIIAKVKVFRRMVPQDALAHRGSLHDSPNADRPLEIPAIWYAEDSLASRNGDVRHVALAGVRHLREFNARRSSAITIMRIDPYSVRVGFSVCLRDFRYRAAA
jgi:hypothetical protein